MKTGVLSGEPAYPVGLFVVSLIVSKAMLNSLALVVGYAHAILAAFSAKENADAVFVFALAPRIEVNLID
ncbi:MAG: hypothetical protein FWG42_11185 [Clostridiales bacterium]|nr:hypothetical protein [Clostridiales bacterium]